MNNAFLLQNTLPLGGLFLVSQRLITIMAEMEVQSVDQGGGQMLSPY